MVGGNPDSLYCDAWCTVLLEPSGANAVMMNLVKGGAMMTDELEHDASSRTMNSARHLIVLFQVQLLLQPHHRVASRHQSPAWID